ncbi:hypothetical protein JOF56_005645 [Kibdelosporangium banguiense]|uniref:YCII-related domain-containing protein n=1 Tax=Kibdelosporangium banguiense TaxID=1365924 RepID=A0ABS4TLI7_9PSEU|nr:YciI family protein [Kibdelosporangium banguiense]MBP2325260.1 hypothetical protein [Kibdelosporangium banguiense]
MRFMMIVKANSETEAGVMPTQEELAEMGRFNDEMTKAGVMLAGDGLRDSSKGFRVSYGPGGAEKVTDGPFAEAKELVAGFWIIEVSSKAEAVQWAKRVPFREGELEVRQVFEEADFA